MAKKAKKTVVQKKQSKASSEGGPAKSSSLEKTARVRKKVSSVSSTATTPSPLRKAAKKTAKSKPAAKPAHHGDISGSPLTASRLPMYPAAPRRRGIVLGQDERRREVPRGPGGRFQYPFDLICQLQIKFPKGLEVGTGWYGGYDVLFTAGHCIFSHKLGGFARSISVWVPARQDYVAATRWGTTDDWKNSASQVADFGFLRIPVKSKAFFNYGDFQAGDFPRKRFYIFGYPHEEKLQQQSKGPALWGQEGVLDRADTNQIFYTMDTGQGQSGAPVFCWNDAGSQNGLPVAVGIHNYGSQKLNTNYATRITRPIVDQLIAWSR